VRDEYALVLPRPSQDRHIRRPVIADTRSVHDIVSVAGDLVRQVRRQVHVEQQSHGWTSGTSCSSARHAA
jgi:hypothetical protein